MKLAIEEKNTEVAARRGRGRVFEFPGIMQLSMCCGSAFWQTGISTYFVPTHARASRLLRLLLVLLDTTAWGQEDREEHSGVRLVAVRRPDRGASKALA